jgi:hypothetical protein
MGGYGSIFSAGSLNGFDMGEGMMLTGWPASFESRGDEASGLGRFDLKPAGKDDIPAVPCRLG